MKIYFQTKQVRIISNAFIQFQVIILKMGGEIHLGSVFRFLCMKMEKAVKGP